MNNFMLIIAVFLVAVLTALFAVPPMINWNDFRGVFEEEASRLLDREVRVGGDVSVRILPVPYVSFEKVRIADAPGIPGSFARADQFKMWLAVPPLLGGVIEARQIELEQPVIRLRTEPDGTGNWRKLQVSKRDLAYIPSEVALNSVRITDGTLLFESDRGQEITKLNKITGELIAGSLSGPYKFIGTMPLGDNPNLPSQEVRLSTARMEDNGEVRFSGSIRSADNRTVHSMNGTMHDLLGKARAEGVLTSRSLPAKTGNPEKGIASGYEMTTNVTLDSKALRLGDIDIAFRNNDRQQSLKGRAVTTWREGLVTQTHLAAGWLDLDAIAGTMPGESPLRAVERLLTEGSEPLGAGVTSVDIKIDQASLAGTSISDLKGRMVRRDGVTRMEALRASLPGRTELAVDGFLERRDTGLQFDGSLLLQSASFAELARWLRVGLDEQALAALTTPFKITGDVRVRPKSVELSQAIITLAEATAEGTVSYNWSARPVLVAALDADALKFDRFGPDGLSPARLARTLGFSLSPDQRRPDAPQPASTLGSTDEPAGPASTDWLRAIDIALSLRARQISDGSRVFSDVDVDFGRNGDNLNLSRFNLTWEPGLKLALSGKLTGVATHPRGNLKGTVAAVNEQAAGHLAELTSLMAGALTPRQAFSGRIPLRIALDAEFDTASPAANGAGTSFSRIIADGTIGNDRIRIAAQTEGSLAGWRNQPAQVNARIAGQDAVTTARWLSGEPIGITTGSGTTPLRPAKEALDQANAPATVTSPATVTMAAAGIPRQKMKSVVLFNAGDALSADFSGELRVAETGGVISPEWSGDLEIRQTTTTMLARLAWPAWLERLPRAPAQGRIAIATTANGYTFEPQEFEIGRTKISGKLSLERSEGGAVPMFGGSIAATEASLPVLSSLLLKVQAEQSTPPASAAEQDVADGAPPDSGNDDASNGVQNVWPDQPFDFAPLAGAQTNVKVEITELVLNDSGSKLNDIAFQLTTSAGRLAITDFAGTVVSVDPDAGAVNARISFDESQAGTRFTADLAATRLALRNWSPQLARAGRLEGTADVTLKLNGQALSPRSLSSLVEGAGELRLTAARLPGMTSNEVTEAARKVIDSELELEELPAQFADLASRSSVLIGDQRHEIRVSNGSLALPAIAPGRGDARLRNVTFVDLPRWWIDSQWTITPEPQPRPDAPDQTVPLPPVSLLYSGSLKSIGAIEAKIDLGDLERELVVRKMEANVARLEQLRREDEARAAAERERQRRIEEEQQRSIEAENNRRLERRGQPFSQSQPPGAPALTQGGLTEGGGVTGQIIRPPQPSPVVPQ